MNKNITIVVPHGDDELLGFGGVIQKHIQNKDNVDVIFARKAIDERTAKQISNIFDAKKILKYRESINLGFSEIDLSHNPLNFFRKLESTLFTLNPDIVYTTFWGDIHQDHKIVFDWVSRAVRVHGPLNVKQFYVGEIPSSTDQNPYIIGDVFKPNFYIKLSEQEAKLKAESILCYKNEVQKYPHPRSVDGILNLSKIRGQECGTYFAEAFMCLRYIE